jgi:hypothetical protein
MLEVPSIQVHAWRLLWPQTVNLQGDARSGWPPTGVTCSCTGAGL